jgi:hypothetical protein
MIASMYTSYAYITNIEPAMTTNVSRLAVRPPDSARAWERERLTNAINRVAGNEPQ